MKNCELSVRTLDEGAIDEKSGMNFSEYIAILSGDTSLLEKTKVEKKVAQLEGYKSAHYKEVARSRYKLEDLEKQKLQTSETLSKLQKDEALYKANLRTDKEGAKVNALELTDFQSAESEEIGHYFNKLYLTYKGPDEQKIGTLYGFDLYVRQQKKPFEMNGMITYQNKNDLYADSPETGIKYLWNHGVPNTDTPKLAARYFLNAIDRVVQLTEKYGKELTELDKEIPVVRQLTQRTFEKEEELVNLKAELKRLEKEISDKITAQAKIAGEAKVVELDHSENLLPIRQASLGR